MSVLDIYRKAAMSIYCLADADKQWLLSRLSTDQSRMISKYIGELDALSLPKSQGFIMSAIEALDEMSEKELYELLNRCVLLKIEIVLDVFEKEPSWIGACLKLEYPGLVNSYISPRLSPEKLLEIDRFINDASFSVTSKLKTVVFDIIAMHLRKAMPALTETTQDIDFKLALERAV